MKKIWLFNSEATVIYWQLTKSKYNYSLCKNHLIILHSILLMNRNKGIITQVVFSLQYTSIMYTWPCYNTACYDVANLALGFYYEAKWHKLFTLKQLRQWLVENLYLRTACSNLITGRNFIDIILKSYFQYWMLLNLPMLLTTHLTSVYKH